jgi:hypothetical protein
MAFASAITWRDVWGSKAVVGGTYTNGNGGGDIGGDIDTGLHMCEFIELTPKSSAVETNAAVVNEALPVAGSAVTIVTDDAADGYWLAIGDMYR